MSATLLMLVTGTICFGLGVVLAARFLKTLRQDDRSDRLSRLIDLFVFGGPAVGAVFLLGVGGLLVLKALGAI